jgi:type IV fimbrial biogenesis protein FimT
MRNKSGFTLMELMVVIAILAIISVLGVPSFINWRNEAKLRDAVSLLRGDMEMAKLRAVRENDFVAVVFNANGYTVFVDDGAGGGGRGNWNPAGTELVLQNRQLPAGVTIDVADVDMFANDRTRFNGRGRIFNQGVVTLNAAGSQRELDMDNRFGRITIN